jgi:hypothetical protein
MMECTPESGHCESICTLSSVECDSEVDA